MRNITVAGLIAAPLLALAMAMPSFAADPAPTTCKDGTTTTSTGKGTCSGHGGVQKAAKAAKAAGEPPDSPLAKLQFDPTQVPDFRVYGGQIVITALELNTLGPITFRQNIGESTWGCDQFVGS